MTPPDDNEEPTRSKPPEEEHPTPGEAPSSQMAPLPLRIAWGLSPAILMTLSAAAGGAKGYGPANEAVAVLLGTALLGGPVILYAWSIDLLRPRLSGLMKYLLALPLAVLACIVNFCLGLAGCAILD